MARAKKGAAAATPAPADAGPNFVTLPEGAAPTEKPPKIGYSPMFVYTHHPLSWVVRGGKLRPDLSKVPIEDGAQGVIVVPGKGSAKATLDLSLMREIMRGHDKTIIPHNVDAPEFKSYMVRPWPGIYVDRFTRLYPNSSRVDCDEEGYCAWLDSLVERKVIPAATVDVIRDKLDALERQLGYSSAGMAKVPEGAGRNLAMTQMEILQGQIEVLREALKGQVDEPGLAAAPLEAEPATLED